MKRATSRLVQVAQRAYTTAPVFVSKPSFFSNLLEMPWDSKDHAVIPSFRVLDQDGSFRSDVDASAQEIIDSLDKDKALKMYDNMLLLPILDNLLLNSQRQGRIPFYMVSTGEEASVIASAAAWSDRDEVFAQYREQGLLLWRGFDIAEMMGNCFGSTKDTSTKGRQMSVHYGSKKHNFVTISSPLTTQLPQAAGAAYAIKRSKEAQTDLSECVIAYCGDGATSEGDFHAGINFAATLRGPSVFFVRNNGYAISTPVNEQYRGDGIASKGPGYGISTLRVDGNCPLAVYVASTQARNLAIEKQQPVLLESMSYRLGAHSTSDDPTAYRTTQETETQKKVANSVVRMQKWIESKGWWSKDWEMERLKEHKKTVLATFRQAQKELKPKLSTMMTDVWAAGTEPPQFKEQQAELVAFIQKWQPLEDFQSKLDKHEPEVEGPNPFYLIEHVYRTSARQVQEREDEKDLEDWLENWAGQL